MPGTFSVPERMPRSWPPPSAMAESCTRGIAAADVQRAYTLGSINFVASDGQKIDVVLLHVHGNFADSLDAVYREENAVFLGDFADFRDRIDHANLVVGVHDSDENRFRRDGFAYIFRIDAAIFSNRQIGYFVAVFLEALTGVQHGLVLNGLGDDVIALFAVHFRDALDHQVVGFGRAAGENDLFRRGVDERSNLLARIFHRFFAGPAEGVVTACGVAEFL